MPIKYYQLPAENLLVAKYSGRTTAILHSAFAQTLREQMSLGKKLSILVDLSDLIETELTGRDMSRRVATMNIQLSQKQTRMRHAIYAPTSSSYAMARMFKGFADSVGHMETQIFDSADGSAAWLGLQHPADFYLQRKDWIDVCSETKVG